MLNPFVLIPFKVVEIPKGFNPEFIINLIVRCPADSWHMICKCILEGIVMKWNARLMKYSSDYSD